jgi:hypothetical protein
MKIQLRLGAICAAFAVSSGAVEALEVLHVSTNPDAVYAAFIEAQFPGSTWVSKPTGLTGDDTIGGDLDRIANFTVVGSHGGTGITVKSYMQSFDLIIVDIPTASANLVDGALGADWSGINKPIIFHPSVAVRATGGRPALFSGDNNVSPMTLDANETTRVSVTALSDTIFAGVTDVTNLYLATSADTINAVATYGSGERLTTLTGVVGASPATHHGIVFWDAGGTNALGQTLASRRAFLPLKSGAINTDLTADGLLVLGNLIDELLVTTPVVFLPPTGIVAKSGIGSIDLSWTVSDGATSYNIKRSTTSGSGHVTISSPGTVTGTTYTDTGLINGTPYYYVISAVDDSPVLESVNSAEVTAIPVPFIYPGIDILFVANSDSAAYKNFASNGQFSANTWTQKATGLTANDTIGGDLDRTATFTGLHGGTGISVRSYLESFDLIIVSGPTTSSNLVDGSNGSDWAELTKPVIFHSNAVVRAAGGRPGLFSGDNFVTSTLVAPDDSTRVSTSALSDALFAGTSSVTDLYSFGSSDLILGTATYGSGEAITRMTDSVTNLSHFGLVFWAASDLTGAGNALAANRAFLPLKGTIDDLNADGKIVLTNLINQIQLEQVTPANAYGSWAALNISLIDPLAFPGFNQDGDGDGILNGLEWMLGGDPLASDPATVSPSSTGDAANGLTLVFNKPVTDSLGSTTLAVEWTLDPASFPNSISIGSSDVGPNGTNPTVDIDAPVPGKVTVNIPAANAPGGKVFGRLRGRLEP